MQIVSGGLALEETRDASKIDQMKHICQEFAGGIKDGERGWECTSCLIFNFSTLNQKNLNAKKCLNKEPISVLN